MGSHERDDAEDFFAATAGAGLGAGADERGRASIATGELALMDVVFGAPVAVHAERRSMAESNGENVFMTGV